MTTPLIRKTGSLEEASWDEALDFSVSRFKEIRDEHGGDGLAFSSSARCTNEENYLFQKLCRAGFINGMMHAILKNNWHDPEFIAERTEGFAELQAHLEKYPPEKASEICGIPPEEIERVARIYATSECSTIIYTLGITEHSHGVDNVKSIANLAMLTGQIGKRSSGVNPPCKSKL